MSTKKKSTLRFAWEQYLKSTLALTIRTLRDIGVSEKRISKIVELVLQEEL